MLLGLACLLFAVRSMLDVLVHSVEVTRSEGFTDFRAVDYRNNAGLLGNRLRVTNTFRHGRCHLGTGITSRASLGFFGTRSKDTPQTLT